MSRYTVLCVVLTLTLAGCPRVASDPPFTTAPACASDADCGRLLDAGCSDVFACIVGRCELIPSRATRCED